MKLGAIVFIIAFAACSGVHHHDLSQSYSDYYTLVTHCATIDDLINLKLMRHENLRKSYGQVVRQQWRIRCHSFAAEELSCQFEVTPAFSWGLDFCYKG